jgi:hypothetical protein
VCHQRKETKSKELTGSKLRRKSTKETLLEKKTKRKPTLDLDPCSFRKQYERKEEELTSPTATDAFFRNAIM